MPVNKPSYARPNVYAYQQFDLNNVRYTNIPLWQQDKRRGMQFGSPKNSDEDGSGSDSDSDASREDEEGAGDADPASPTSDDTAPEVKIDAVEEGGKDGEPAPSTAEGSAEPVKGIQDSLQRDTCLANVQ